MCIVQTKGYTQKSKAQFHVCLCHCTTEWDEKSFSVGEGHLTDMIDYGYKNSYNVLKVGNSDLTENWKTLWMETDQKWKTKTHQSQRGIKKALKKI